jgi:hypothetical protein
VIEYYSALDDALYNDVLNRMQLLLKKPEVNVMLYPANMTQEESKDEAPPVVMGTPEGEDEEEEGEYEAEDEEEEGESKEDDKDDKEVKKEEEKTEEPEKVAEVATKEPAKEAAKPTIE